MALEKRGNSALRRYYYRKKRIGDRVASVYAGAGAVGIVKWVGDNASRRHAQLERTTALTKRSDFDITLRNLDLAIRDLTCLANQVLGACGLHEYKGQWRRKRAGKKGQSNQS